MKLSSNIVVIAIAGNLNLLIKKSNLNNQLAKCVVVRQNGRKITLADTYENIQIPLKFNAFDQINEEQSANKILIFDQSLTDEDIKKINTFLK